MSILKSRFCPACREKTYHRYQSSLSCRFTSGERWECLSCNERKKGKRRKSKRLGLSQDLVTDLAPDMS